VARKRWQEKIGMSVEGIMERLGLRLFQRASERHIF